MQAREVEGNPGKSMNQSSEVGKDMAPVEGCVKIQAAWSAGIWWSLRARLLIMGMKDLIPHNEGFDFRWMLWRSLAFFFLF